MQDSKKDTDVYSGLLDSEGQGEGGMIWENDMKHVYYHVRIELSNAGYSMLGAGAWG